MHLGLAGHLLSNLVQLLIKLLLHLFGRFSFTPSGGCVHLSLSSALFLAAYS